MCLICATNKKRSSPKNAVCKCGRYLCGYKEPAKNACESAMQRMDDIGFDYVGFEEGGGGAEQGE